MSVGCGTIAGGIQRKLIEISSTGYLEAMWNGAYESIQGGSDLFDSKSVMSKQWNENYEM